MNGTMNRSIRWMRVADDWKEGEKERGRIEEGLIGSYKLPYTLFALCIDSKLLISDFSYCN